MEIISLHALLAVIGCGLCFAGADFVRKTASSYCSPAILIAIVFSSVSPFYIGIFLLSPDKTWDISYILPGMMGVISNILGNIFFVRAVAASHLSKTIPLLSLTPVLTALISWIFLAEALTGQQWAGIVFVVIGILWLYVPAGHSFSFTTVANDFIREKGAVYMCMVALFWTLTPIFDRVALQYTTVPIHSMVHFTGGALLLWIWIYFRGGLSKASLPSKEGWKIIGLLSLFYALALGLQMLALKLTYVGIMESVKRVIGQISAVTLGHIILKEPVTKPKIFGIITMCIGVPMVILPGFLVIP